MPAAAGNDTEWTWIAPMDTPSTNWCRECNQHSYGRKLAGRGGHPHPQLRCYNALCPRNRWLLKIRSDETTAGSWKKWQQGSKWNPTNKRKAADDEDPNVPDEPEDDDNHDDDDDHRHKKNKKGPILAGTPKKAYLNIVCSFCVTMIVI
jgi:hypothetical protein